MFDLLSPCKACPFRKKVAGAFALPLERLEEIRTATAFQCHSTLDYHFPPGDYRRAGKKPQQCAGLMAVLDAMGQPNAMMGLAEKVGLLDPGQLDRRDAFEAWADVLAAHGHEGGNP